MTPTQGIDGTTPPYLRFIQNPVPDKVWQFVGGFLYNYPRELDCQAFVELFEYPQELLAFMANAWEDTDRIFPLKDGRFLKFSGSCNRGYFFDITDQIQQQVQIHNIMDVAADYIRNRTTLSEAIGIVERNVRFE